MIKKILGTIAGIILAMVVVGGMDTLSHRLFPESVARSMDYADIAAAIAAAPVGAKAIMVAGWFLAVLIGGSVAVRISQWPASGWIITGLILAGCLFNGFMIPGVPLWMQIAGVAAPLGAGVLVKGLSRPR
jgi:hypothetical protein